MGVPVLDYAGLTLALFVLNLPTVWFFCSYLPRRWDSRKPGAIPDAPGLIPYTSEEPDLRGLV